MAGGFANFLFVAGGLLVCGTFNSLIAKLIYGLKAPGLGGRVHLFEKPWFQTTNMFLGMILCMGMYRLKLAFLARVRRSRGTEGSPLLKPGDAPTEGMVKRGAWLLIATSIADLAATGLMFSGLMFTTVSVYQMLRGAEVVFCAMLSVVFLKAQLDQFMKMGVFITVLGICLVGAASLVSGTSGAEVPIPMRTQIFGIFLIIVAQFLQAVQVVIEEWLLQDVQMDALEVAGWEGIWGGLLCIFVVMPLFQTLPGPDSGSLENTHDSLLMLRNNHAIILAEVLNCLSVLSYNYFGLTLTQDFTAMHRVIIEASRSILVWGCDLAIFYFLTDGEFGESWHAVGSWLQLVGFAVLLVGTYIYNYTTIYSEAHYSELQDIDMEEQVQLLADNPADRRTLSELSKSSARSRNSALSGGSGRLRHH